MKLVNVNAFTACKYICTFPTMSLNVLQSEKNISLFSSSVALSGLFSRLFSRRRLGRCC